MMKNKLNYQLLNLLMFCTIIFLALITKNDWIGFISKVFSILSPFVVAFAIAYALYPLVRILRKKGVGNKLSIIFVVVAILFLIIGLLVVTIPIVYDQLISLSSIIGEVISDLSNKFELNLGDFQANIDEILGELIQSIGQYVSTGTIDFVGKSINYVTNGIIIAIVSVYFLFDMDKIRTGIRELLQKRKKTFHFVKKVDHELVQYLQGLIIFMLIQFVEYSFLFKIVGHPNWLLLGILASVTTIIPYFGGLITNIIAVILASVVSSPLFFATLAICLIFPNVDGYIISPRVYGKTNNIDPLWSIFAVFAGGALFGFIGIVISLPLYIVLNCAFQYYKEDIYDKIEDIKEKNDAKKA